MTRFLAATLLVAAFSTPLCQAQWEGHLRLGGSAFSLVGDDDTDFSSIGRFFGGAGLSVPVRGGFALRGEANYVVRGAQTSNAYLEQLDLEIDAVLTVSYIEIPLLVEYRRYLANGYRPAVYAGAAFSRKIDARIRYKASVGGPSFEETDDSAQEDDIGLIVGAEVGVPMRGDRIVAGVRGYFGLSNTRHAEPALHHRGAQVYLGVTF